MLNSSTEVPLKELFLLFGTLLLLGTLATLPLYGWSFRRLFSSKIFTKILFWIPIFIFFVISLYLSIIGQLVICIFIAVLALKDVLDNFISNKKIIIYYLTFLFCLFHFPLFEIFFSENYINLLIAIAIGSVLADVMAYFLGNYAGHHKLPEKLNNNKSWEGVFGELLGAFIGVIIVSVFIIDLDNIYIFIPIGFGSITGDLVNSYVKRNVGIREWSNRLPGHGGYLDRFSSLTFAITFSFYWLLIF